jgi:hypothetical protein
MQPMRRFALVLLAVLVACACSRRAGPDPSAALESRIEARVAELVEANVRAVHAYQTLLARYAGRGDFPCFTSSLSDAALGELVARQSALLSADPAEVRLWTLGRPSTFDPTRDFAPLAAAPIDLAPALPVTLMTAHLAGRARAHEIRAVANLYQTILEIERDGDLLQSLLRFYAALGLPISPEQLHMPGSDADFLATGQALASRTCHAPFDVDASAWQIAGRKLWNWGEKILHIRDGEVIADELARDPEIVRLARAVPWRRIAVLGHSFTMAEHWASPSSFTELAAILLRRQNQGAHVAHFSAGGLTASKAKRELFEGVLAHEPDLVLFVLLRRTREDDDALGEMGERLARAGIASMTFDDVRGAAEGAESVLRLRTIAKGARIRVVDVGEALRSAPDRDRFVCLDGIHMTEPYHRLMAQRWLEALASP